jgi:hypothetical protein
MSVFEWRHVPVGLDARRWVTRTACRTVLVAVHTVTSGQRLMDVVRLLGPDLRIQVVFTVAPDVFGEGVEEFLRTAGAIVVPWLQATQLEFDLALAAGYGSIHELHAPLVVVPHGAGYSKLTVQWQGGRTVARTVYGLDTQRLIHNGSVVPAAIVLAHQADLATLARSCPEAVPAASVVGDPCYDLLVASTGQRLIYRRSLAVTEGQKLVVVASTWGTRSLFGQADGLLPRLVAELPGERFRVVTLLHPNVWNGHGTWQVRSWLAGCLRQGLGLVPPAADWRGVLVAADWIIADHGSLGVYGAAVNVPLILAGFAERRAGLFTLIGSREPDADPESASALLASTAPRLHPGRSLRGQLSRAAAAYSPSQYEQVTARITSQPGRFDQNMRRLMYRLLRLRQPAVIPAARVAEPPFLIT